MYMNLHLYICRYDQALVLGGGGDTRFHRIACEELKLFDVDASLYQERKVSL